MKKKVIDAKADKDGNITSVLLEGNRNYTSLEKAIQMTKDGKLEGVNVSKTKEGREYLRKNKNNKKKTI